MRTDGKLVYGTEDRPPFGMSAFLGLQYVLLSIGPISLSPILISHACDLKPAQTEYLIFATMLVCAVSTLIQVHRPGNIGSGYLMLLGPSGAFLSCSIAAVSIGGLPLLGTMTLLSAPLEALISYLIRFVRKVFTPALGGTVIMLVAMLIIPHAIGMWMGKPGSSRSDTMAAFLSGLAPILVLLGAWLTDRGWVRLWSPLLAVLAGLGVAFLFGITDFSVLAGQPLLALPSAGWPGLEWQLSWRHLPLLITFCMATFSSTIETFGDTVALQTVSEGRLTKIKYDRVQGGMYVDAVGSALGGLAGVTANTTYSTVMPVIQLTRVASRHVGYFIAAILALFAFLPKVAYFFTCVPGPVMGGLGVGLMVILFGEGLKVVASVELSSENALVAGTGLGMGLLASLGQFFPALFPESYRFLASDVMTAGGMSALLLNILFVYKVRRTETLLLPADLSRLPDLHARIEGFEDRLRLTERQSFALQLACEEVFACLCRQNPDTVAIRFHWKSHPEGVLTEISAHGELTDIDTPIDPDRLRRLDGDELNELGLLLLARVAVNVEHATISGHQYIQFRV